MARRRPHLSQPPEAVSLLPPLWLGMPFPPSTRLTRPSLWPGISSLPIGPPSLAREGGRGVRVSAGEGGVTVVQKETLQGY